MKELIIYATIMAVIASCNNHQLVKTGSLTNEATTVTPAALLTVPGESWKVSAAESAGRLVKAKFETGGNFTFSYSNKNAEQDITTVEGKAVFTINEHGENIFTLRPLNTRRFVNNKEITLTNSDPEGKFCTTYRWEKINFTAMPSEIFLLLVDVEEHPAAAFTKAGSIDKSWVAKFYSR